VIRAASFPHLTRSLPVNLLTELILVSRLVPRSLFLGAAFALMAGTGFAATDAVQLGALSEARAAEHMESSDTDVAGAAVDLADAEEWLAELEAGNFANTFVIENDGSMRCGEVAANAACKPLTDADKASAIAEAREAVGLALAAIEASERSFAATEDARVEEAAFAR
jgi:uncharacterized protein (DUF39 family)